MKPVLIYYDILRFQPEVLARMAERFEVRSLPDPSHDMDGDAHEALSRAEVLLAPLGYPVDAAKMDRCPELRVIASSTLRTPHIDREEAARRGIRVVCLEHEQAMLNRVTATAELAWGLIIALTRRMPWSVADARSGHWRGRYWGAKTPRMLSRMRLGVVGLGRLGSLVAGYGLAFGMNVGYYSPRSGKDGLTTLHSLNELAEWADIISMHANHTPETEAMCDAGFFAAMRPGSYFVNTARGELVDEGALLDALESGHLGGAALDVLAGVHQPGFAERVPDHPLVRYAREHDNLILTPYYGGATQDAWAATQMRTVELAEEAYDESLQEARP